MVKPARSMQPEGVDLKKAGRAAGKAFQDDSFRNYMARKIDLQRKQFGVIPPPPPPPAPSALHPSTCQPNPALNPSTEENIDERPRKKRKTMSMASILQKLKRRHGDVRNLESTEQTNPKSSSDAKINPPCTTLMTQMPSSDPVIDESIDEPPGAEFMEQEAELERKASAAINPSTSSHRKQRPDLFFSGIVVVINGYTHPDAESLQRLLQDHGGDVERYETTRVTHILAEHLSTAKAKIYAKQRKPFPVVYPSWVLACVEAKRLLPHAEFLIKEVRDTQKQPSVATFFQSAAPPGGAGDQETPPLDSDNEKFPLQQSTSVNSISEPVNCQSYHDVDYSMKSREDDTNSKLFKSNVQQKDDSRGAIRPTSKSILNPYLKHKKTVAERTSLQSHQIPVNPTEERTAQQKPAEMANMSSSGGRTDDKYIDGKIRTVGTDPHFLETFFAESRLSFIGSFRQRTSVKPNHNTGEPRSLECPKNRYVLHIDMDSFFAAVVLRNYPEYKDKPVAICHYGKSGPNSAETASKESTSECATCNYHARKYGIQKGMFLGRARALCPSLIVLPYDFAGYEEVSEQVSEICQKYASEHYGTVEAVSCDESYMEVHVHKSSVVTSLAQDIRRDIFEKTKCTATIGIATNKFLAKLATDRVKPDGWYLAADHTDLLKGLKLRDLHGVGYRTEPKLAKEGFETVLDVWNRGEGAERELQAILGNQLGSKIYKFCHGIDHRPVRAAGRQTIGAECNYGVRFDGPYGVGYMIDGLCKEVQKRMEHACVMGTKIMLKVKQRKEGAKPPPKFLGHGSCHNLSKSADLPRLTRDWELISDACKKMFRDMNVPEDDVRGMGIIMSKLVEDGNESTGGIRSFFRPKRDGLDETDEGPAEPALPIEHIGGDGSEEAERPQRDNRSSVIEICESDDGGDDEEKATWSFAQEEDNDDREIVILSQMSNTSGCQLDSLKKSVSESRGTKEDDGFSPGFEPRRQLIDLFSPVGDKKFEESLIDETRQQPDYPEILHVQDLAQERVQQPVDSPELSDHELETRDRQSMDSFDDIALPPLSQIRMSQVKALPTPMRRKIHSMLAEQKAPANAASGSASGEGMIVVAAACSNRDLAPPPPKYRQTNVMRMMRLAAVKAGHAHSRSSTDISLTQLERLPFEIQLQVANNDTLSLGTHTPMKKKGNGKRNSGALPRAKNVDKYPATKRVAAIRAEGGRNDTKKRKKAPKVSIPLYESSMSDQEFFRENILPLSSFMDEHRVSDESLALLRDFMTNFVKEYSWNEVALVIRSLQNRTDEWSSSDILEPILNEVKAEFHDKTGDFLDID